MTVLHIIDSPDRGGTEMLALDLCRNAKINGLDLIFVVTKKGSLDNDFQNSGVEYYHIPRNFPIDPLLIFRLKKLIRKRGIKILHAHQAVDAMQTYLAALGTRAKNIMTFHGHVPSKKDDLTFKFLIPRMDANIAVSNAFLKRLKKDIKFDTSKNFYVIYNGIDTKKFYKTNKNFRSELRITNDDLLIGMVGNFYNDGRDQLTVCKSLPDVFAKYPKIHFTFVGGRSDKYPHFFDDCYNFCRDNNILDRTHFVGLRSDINDILNSLDIFIFSSNHDTFGISIIEAMLSNLPVIINDLDPLLEITGDGKFAKIFKSKNVDDLKEKLSELIENPMERKRLAEEGRQWAMNRYSIENYISNLKNLYNSL